MIDLIQRKVTHPVVESGVSKLVNKAVEDYQASNQSALTAYINEINEKAPATAGKITEGSKAEAPKVSKQEIKHRAVELSAQALVMAQELSSQPSSEFISNLSLELKQPVYVFKDGKLVEAHGQDKAAKSKNPISLAYDSKTGKYVSLSAKTKDSHDSIYAALSSVQSKYAASDLVKMHYALVAAAQEVEKDTAKTEKVASKDTGKTGGPAPKPPVGKPGLPNLALQIMLYGH